LKTVLLRRTISLTSPTKTGTRTCSICGETKDLDQFYANRSKSQGRSTLCKPCERKSQATLRQLHSEHQIPDDHSCPICMRTEAELVSEGQRTKNPFRLDHNHGTGEFRGFLCDSCNTGLGKFRDDPDLLARAIEYLGGGIFNPAQRTS
jgi:hypothetical protein